MMTLNEMLLRLHESEQINDPRRKGQRASKAFRVGEFGRYAVYAVHTRFDAPQWFVADAEIDDGGMPAIIRQEETPEAALAGLVE